MFDQKNMWINIDEVEDKILKIISEMVKISCCEFQFESKFDLTIEMRKSRL